MPEARGAVGVGVAEGAVADEGPGALLIPKGFAASPRGPCVPVCRAVGFAALLPPACPVAPLQPQRLPSDPVSHHPSTPKPCSLGALQLPAFVLALILLGSMAPASWAHSCPSALGTAGRAGVGMGTRRRSSLALPSACSAPLLPTMPGPHGLLRSRT